MVRSAPTKDATWIFGVLVALSVREALLPTIAHLKTHVVAGSRWAMWLEEWRVSLFILLLIRFYFGALAFFSRTHGEEVPEWSVNPRFGFDFVIGLLHFIVFLVLATTITMHDRGAKGLSSFETWLFVVLLYDVLWLLFCYPFKGVRLVNFWTVINVATFLISVALLFACSLLGADPVLSEHIMMLPVFAISILDLFNLVNHPDHPIPKWWDSIVGKIQTSDTDT